MGFGRHVGLENRAKSEKKSIEKRIEKIMEKRCLLAAPGGEVLRARQCPAGFLAPPNYHLPITNTPQPTDHSPQASRTLSHALRASAVADIFYDFHVKTGPLGAHVDASK